MLNVSDLTVGHNGNPLLTDVSFSVAGGELVWLRGPSGSGKTTLCMSIAGYMPPLSGSIGIDGRVLSGNSSKRQPYPIQYIGQHPELMLDPRMRMRESLREAGMLSDVDPLGGEPHSDHGHSHRHDFADISEEQESLLAHLGIRHEWLDRYPNELSGGEMQRFCIARALFAKPRYLICDEISTMLDALTQARLWHVLIDEADARDMGVIFTTHSDSLGEIVATRTLDISCWI